MTEAKTTPPEAPFPQIPDFLGKAARIRANAEALFQGQAQRDHLERQVRMGRVSPDDQIPGTGTTSKPEGETHQFRIDALTQGLKDVWADVVERKEDEETTQKLALFLEQDQKRFDAKIKEIPKD